MSEEQGKRESLVKPKVDALTERLESEKHADNTHLDAYRDMLRAAHACTNGSAHKIESLADLVASVTVVLTQEKLREPERLRTAFAGMHGSACPVEPLITVAADGTRVMPWTAELEQALRPVVAKLEAREGGVIEFGKFKAKGSAVAAVVGAVAAVAVVCATFYFLLARQDEALRRELPRLVRQSAAEAGLVSPQHEAEVKQ